MIAVREQSGIRAGRRHARARRPLGENYNGVLLPQDQRDRFEIVLVSPRNPLNIGAVARAMANFGFVHLSVVAPFEPHWREAKSAVGASKVLQNAKRAERLVEALADCAFVVGTGSLGRRKPEQPVVPLPELAALIQKQMGHGERIALVFGSEKRGLSRDDLAHCHVVTAIPTDPLQPSMNLGQAVAVCLYEITTRMGESAQAATWGQEAPVPATTSELELLASVIEETMYAAKYSPAAMRQANRHDLDLLLRRIALTDRDAARILGFFRRMLWQLKR